MKSAKILLSILLGFIICQFGIAQTLHTVTMVNYEFQPSTMTIMQGDTVMWVNQASLQQHTTTSGSNCSNSGLWNSGLLSPGETFMYVFDSTGTFPYFCIPHCALGMTGTITVDPFGTGIARQPIRQNGNSPVEILSVIPNPFKNYARIKYKVYEPTQIRARLINALGQEKFSTETFSTATGEQQTAISTAGLESGVYFLHLMVKGKVVAVQKLLKL